MPRWICICMLDRFMFIKIVGSLLWPPLGVTVLFTNKEAIRNIIMNLTTCYISMMSALPGNKVGPHISFLGDILQSSGCLGFFSRLQQFVLVFLAGWSTQDT